MTPERRAEIRAVCDAATPGPWEIDARMKNVVREPWPIDWVGVAGQRTDLPPSVFTGQVSNRERARWEADAAFIALARSALPEALDRIEELETALADVIRVTERLPHEDSPLYRERIRDYLDTMLAARAVLAAGEET